MKPIDSNNSSRNSTLNRRNDNMKPLVLISTYEERQEDLKKTTIMRDETDHRSPPPPTPQKLVANHKNHCAIVNGKATTTNGQQNGNGHYHHQAHQHSFTENYNNGNHNMMNDANGNMNGGTNGATNGHFPTPPPPPQFANKPSSMSKKIYASINAFNAANNINGQQKNNDHLQRTISQNYHNHHQVNPEIPPNEPPPPPPPLPQSPIPDYETIRSPSPTGLSNTLPKQYQHQYKHSQNCASSATNNVSTLGRVAASEIAKANGDMAELESIDSYQMLNPSSPTPKPPSAYFVPPNSGPPTMKKSNRPVSVTIGEYGASKMGGRKEPGKFDFIASRSGSNSPNDLNSPMSPNSPLLSGNGKDENVSHMLRSELELTLSRSNLKKRHDFTNGANGNTVVQFNNGIYSNGSFQQLNNGQNNNGNGYNDTNGHNYHNQNEHSIKNPINSRNIAYQSNNGYHTQYTNSVKQPLSSNVEKITNMLQNMNHHNGGNNTYESTATLTPSTQNNNYNGATTNSNSSTTRVTISLPNSNSNGNNKIDLRKTDSMMMTGSASVIAPPPPPPSNGILKNSINGSRNSFGDKSITFGN